MQVIEREVTYTVKGTSITFKEKIKIDEKTREEIYDPKLEQENDITLYNEYRKLNSLLFPEEIKAIREKYGVTQVEFAQILGLGDKTITRYENGSLQDNAQNNLIKIVGRNSEEFLKLLKECKKLSKERIEELLEEINLKNNVYTIFINTSSMEFINTSSMEFTNTSSMEFTNNFSMISSSEENVNYNISNKSRFTI